MARPVKLKFHLPRLRRLQIRQRDKRKLEVILNHPDTGEVMMDTWMYPPPWRRSKGRSRALFEGAEMWCGDVVRR